MGRRSVQPAARAIVGGRAAPPSPLSARIPGLAAGLLIGLALLWTPAGLLAQCATCGNPAFVSGGKDIGQTLTPQKEPQWQLRTSLVWGTGGADTYYQNDEDVGNLDAFELSMHVFSLLASVQAPTGTSLSAVLPWGRLHSDRRFHDPVVDSGLGDLEVRLRQDVLRPLGLKGEWVPQVHLSLGFVAPTGNYIEREDALTSQKKEVVTDPTCLTCGDFCPDHCAAAKVDTGADAPADESANRYLNLGRGAWWALADLDVAGRIADRLGYYAGLSYRQALGRAPDGFGWGAEQRWTAGLTGVVVPRWLSVQLLAEYERRAMSTDGTDDNWVWFDNGGGHFVNLSPTLQTSPLPGLSVSATLRWPLYRDVIGTQVVENPSVWISVSGTLDLGDDPAPTRSAAAPRPKDGEVAGALKASAGMARVGQGPGNPEIQALLAAGKVTIVDYWAEWCAPCQTLAADLVAFEKAGRADVVVVRFDATDWKEADWVRFLPDAPTLPVIDIYDAQGRLLVRLSGEPAFDFRDHLPK